MLEVKSIIWASYCDKVSDMLFGIAWFNNIWLPKIGCSWIFLQASSTCKDIGLKIEETSPLPISMHSAYPPVPYLISASSSVSLSSLHFYLTPWNMAVGTGSFYFGPFLSLETKATWAFFLECLAWVCRGTEFS
jgi:hypothetical protein